MKPRLLIGSFRQAFLHPLDDVILVTAWAVVNGTLYSYYGVKIVTDSPRYLNYAQKIIDALAWYEPHSIWYLGYVLFVVVAKALFRTEGAVIAMQVVAHGLAAVLLYRTSYHLFTSRGAALVSALLFITWIELPAWSFYVLAESWYVSLICLTLYCLVTFDGSPWRSLLTTLVVLLTFMTKPTGIAVLVGYGVFLASYYLVRWLRTTIAALGLLMLPFLYMLVNQMLSSFILVEQYTTGEVVYGMSVVQGYLGKEQLVLPVRDLVIPSVRLTPILRLLTFVVNNPVYFAQLALLKMLYLLGHVRPYYSSLHNAFIAFTLYPLYLLAAGTWWQLRINMPFKRFLLVFLVVNVAAIMLTSVDWDGRFLMPLLPVIFLLSGKPLGKLLDQYLLLKP